MLIIKRDGRKEEFDFQKVINAVEGAFNDVDEKLPIDVIEALKREIKVRSKLQWHVEEIQDLVEYVLGKLGYQHVLHQFVVYRERKRQEREEKKRILKRDWLTALEKRLSVNVIKLLAVRYLWKTEDGNGFKETVDEMFMRVAIFGALPEVMYDAQKYLGKLRETTYLEKWRRTKFDEVAKYLPEDWQWWRGVEKDDTEWQKLKQRLLKEGMINDDEVKAVSFNHPRYGKVYLTIYHLERLFALSTRFDYQNIEMSAEKKFEMWLKMIVDGQAEGFYEWMENFYEMMINQIAMPNTPALINGGRPLGMPLACYVVPTGDSVNNIFQTAYDIAMITKMGGGIGLDLSVFRPNGDIVRGTNGVSSGALSWLDLYNETLDVLQQGSTRRGAGMGVMWYYHPEIVSFIKRKENNDGYSVIPNFNISIGVDEVFWKALWKDDYIQHRNPRNNKIVGMSRAKDLLMFAAQIAWKSADPGLLNFHAHNKHFPLKQLGKLHATNPCGEEALLPYQSCNLISINVHKFVKEGKFDFDEFKKWIRIATRWADNMNDVSNFPLPENEYMVRKFRNVGVGMMGLANALFELEIPYNSERGFRFMEKLAETLSKTVIEYSIHLAQEKYPSEASHYYAEQRQVNLLGISPEDKWNKRIMAQIKRYGIRNIDHTTMPPTGSVSMIAETSSGIEPQFALAFVKDVVAGKYVYTNKVFEKYVHKHYPQQAYDIINSVAETGNISRVREKLTKLIGEEEVEKLQRIFVTAMEIHWYEHVIAQYHIQKWITNAISKTINMPSYATVDDVFKVYVLAGVFDLKGITIYRNGSLSSQVLKAKDEAIVMPPSKYTLALIQKKTAEIGGWVKKMFEEEIVKYKKQSKGA